MVRNAESPGTLRRRNAIAPGPHRSGCGAVSGSAGTGTAAFTQSMPPPPADTPAAAGGSTRANAAPSSTSIIGLSMALDRAEQPQSWSGSNPITRNPSTVDPATHVGVCSPCILHKEGRDGKDK
jgi:hypothetical protein